MTTAKRVFRGEYRTDYVYHAQMEPMNATALVSPDGKSAELWVGTQAATSLLKGVAGILQTDRNKPQTASAVPGWRLRTPWQS